MATLVFGIETVGEEWSVFDKKMKERLTKWLHTGHYSEADIKRHTEEMIQQFRYSPFTGTVSALALHDVERKQSMMYRLESEAADTGEIKIRSEEELLQEFWEGSYNYDVFVGFNSRSYVLPFLLHRSAILEITPRRELLGRRFLTQQTHPYHVDIYDEFIFQGALNRKPSLALLCRAYSISYQAGEREEQLLRDVEATACLYEKWKQYFAPAAFLNAIEF